MSVMYVVRVAVRFSVMDVSWPGGMQESPTAATLGGPRMGRARRL